ncbi:hypothetical protein WMF38_57425 [Sorangium sp. So ce118]
MALLALGSIAVASSGEVTKSGECEAVYDLLYADAEAAAADAGASLPSGPASVAFKKSLARMSTTIATYVYTALTVRAKAKITTADSGLQRTPNPNVANAATQAPNADKLLSIV